MKHTAQSFADLIGNTPLLQLNQIEKKLDLKAHLFAKVEGMNPAGSAKDRVGKMMIDEAERLGVLKSGAVIIEPTSGNTGIGLAAVARARGYRVILTMPDSMSEERRALLRAYGAELVLTEGARGMAGAVEKANELAAEIDGSFIPGQFDNPANPLAHYRTTGPEIWRDMDGDLDIFVASVGTGGTLSGCAKYLKEQKNDIFVCAVEPAASPLLSKGVSGPHKVQGIGANFVPENLDRSLIDEILPISDDDAFFFGKLLAEMEGLLAGISSGAALSAAVQLAKREENEGKNIVLILPDSGERYLSTPLFG